jgi:UDP-3-O-[3-hydroxymyristoyl] glucosamine N-acyltransferase
MGFCSLRWMCCLLLLSAFGIPAFAEGSHDRTQFGHDVTVGSDEKVAEVTCFACSVRVRGRVDGDVTTFGGSVVVERDAVVGGDITTFGGDLRLDGGASVKDVTVFGGRFRRDSGATVGGDVTTFGGGVTLWLFIVFGVPFLLLGGFIVLIIWLIRRFTRPAVPAAARV